MSTASALSKPLFMDESAHDWTFVRMGRELGWNGVALKTCKTLTGALLSLCWAKHHGMGLMVQDLTNPMLAQIPHVLLAAHAGTIMGVESNGMQFYPEASLPEEAVHPGLYRRRGGILDTATLAGGGFGYRIDEIARKLPAPAAVAASPSPAPPSSSRTPTRCRPSGRPRTRRWSRSRASASRSWTPKTAAPGAARRTRGGSSP